MDKKTLRIEEIQKETGIEAPTLYRYLKQFPEFIHQEKQGRRVHIPEDSIPILKNIRTMFKQGRTQTEIRNELMQDKQLIQIVTMEQEGSEQALMFRSFMEQSLQMMQDQREEMASLKKMNERQSDQIRSLERKLDAILQPPEPDKKGRLSRIFGR